MSARTIVAFKEFMRNPNKTTDFQLNSYFYDRLESNFEVQSLYTLDDFIEDFKILEQQSDEFNSIDFTPLFKSFEKFLAPYIQSNGTSTTDMVLNFLYAAVKQRIIDLKTSKQLNFITDSNTDLKNWTNFWWKVNPLLSIVAMSSI